MCAERATPRPPEAEQAARQEAARTEGETALPELELKLLRRSEQPITREGGVERKVEGLRPWHNYTIVTLDNVGDVKIYDDEMQPVQDFKPPLSKKQGLIQWNRMEKRLQGGQDLTFICSDALALQSSRLQDHRRVRELPDELKTIANNLLHNVGNRFNIHDTNPTPFNPSRFEITPDGKYIILADPDGVYFAFRTENESGRISEAFGYIRFSIDIFSDSVTEIKGFKQDYDSPQRYDFEDGTQSTVKARLMQRLVRQGGTNMLDGIRKAAGDLSKEVEEYPDYASAFYFVGDGGDTCGNTDNIRRFLQTNDTERGFGEHMHSAILLGDESQRQTLAAIFGEEHTNVAPDFDELIEKSMDRFDEDIEEHLRNKIQG